MSLSDVRRKVAEVMGSDDLRKCRSCGQSAKHETLADHGGMCFPCFAAYCRMPKTAPKGGGMSPVTRRASVMATTGTAAPALAASSTPCALRSPSR